MELEIEDKLQEIYKNLTVEVNFKEFRVYEILIKLEAKGKEYASKIEYQYNANLTFNRNIDKIVNIIDNEIIIAFFKKEE